MRGPDLRDVSYLTPLDGERFLDELDLAGRAQRRKSAGEADRMSEDAGFRSRLEARLDALRQTAANDTQKRLNMMGDLIHQHAASIDFTRTETEIAADLSRMKVEAGAAAGEIETLYERYREQRAHFAEFRARRGLRRPAAPPPNVLRYTLVLYVLWVLEAAMNMLFFAGGNVMGLAGGFVLALLVSSVNIGAAFAVGFLLTKWINSVFLLRKAIGWLSSLVFLPLLIAGHFVVAHYRAQQMLAAEEGEFLANSEYFALAVAALFENFWVLPDFESYILLIIGTGFGPYAWWKGYHFGDRYPGYTKEYKDLEEHRLDYEWARDDLVQRLEGVRDTAIGRITAFIDSVGPSVQAMLANAAAARSLVEHYRTFLKSCARTAELAWAEYVDTACGGRAPEGAPVETPDSSSEIAELSRMVEQMAAEASAARDGAEAVRKAARSYRDEVLSEIKATEREIVAKIGGRDGEA